MKQVSNVFLVSRWRPQATVVPSFFLGGGHPLLDFISEFRMFQFRGKLHLTSRLEGVCASTHQKQPQTQKMSAFGQCGREF